MNRRRAILGLCLVCALALSAFAAQGAGASTKGTTGFTCKEKKEKGGAGFSRAHCAAADAVGSEAKYEHVAFAVNKTTEVKGTNKNTEAETTAASTVSFKETVGGVETELQATGWSGTGWMTNAIDPVTGEHYVHDGGTVTFTGVTVTKPSGKGCKVFTNNSGTPGAEGTIDTGTLVVTSKGQSGALKFEGSAGAAFATFFFECTTKVPSCEGLWEITGSLKGTPDGATVTFSHGAITTENTLKGKGAKAGFNGKVTISARDPELKETEYTPLSVTTVETP